MSMVKSGHASAIKNVMELHLRSHESLNTEQLPSDKKRDSEGRMPRIQISQHDFTVHDPKLTI